MTALSTDIQIAVIGAGTMGAGIAQVAAQAGHAVLLFDVVDGAAERAIEQTAKGLEKLVDRGKITAEDVANIIDRITPAGSINDLASAGLVIEAIVEDMGVKQKLFTDLEEICGENTLLATNTSSLSVTAIASKLKRPENFVGLHFFNPAQVMKLVEVIRGTSTLAAVADTAFDTALAWGKKPVHAKSTPGFIVNRVARPFYAEALRVLEEGGADIATIDAILKESAGFRMGPFELMDLIGNDVNLAVTHSVFRSFHFDPRYKPSLVQEELVASGNFGRKTGAGFYTYADGAAPPEPDTATDCPRPDRVSVYGDLGVAAPLVYMIREAGISLKEKQADSQQGYLKIGEARVLLTDGGLASEHGGNTVLLDLALDYENATRVALAPSDSCDSSALQSVIGLFQALGKTVSIIDDVPGMVAMRTVCMLANEGAEAVHQGVCTEQAVDTAMFYGVNYPFGPLAWANKIGIAAVEQVLDNLGRTYTDVRYRCSVLIRRKVLSGLDFLD